MGSCSCTRRHFLLSICFLQMITIIERQVFDFLGYMWAPILVNFFQILFIIFGFYGAYHFRIKYIITYLLWMFVWIGWNAFMICFYLNVGSLDRESDLLNMGTGSVSWFEANGYGCKPTYNITADDPFRPLRPERVEDCLLDYILVEVIHSGVQCALALLGILGAILISCIFLDEDDRFDFMNGDAKSPQHTVVHPMYVSYTSIPTTSASATMQSNKQLQLQHQQQQLQQLQLQQQQQQNNSLQFNHQHQRHNKSSNNHNNTNTNNNNYSNCNSYNNTLNNVHQPQHQPLADTAINHNAYNPHLTHTSGKSEQLAHNNSSSSGSNHNVSGNSGSGSHSSANSHGNGQSNNASLNRLKSQSRHNNESSQIQTQSNNNSQRRKRLYQSKANPLNSVSPMSMSPQSAQTTPSLSYASLQNSNPQLAASLSNSNYSIFHAANSGATGDTSSATSGHFARIHHKPKPPKSQPDVKYTQMALDRLSRNLEEDEDNFSLQHLTPSENGVTYVPFQSPTPNSLFVGGSESNNNSGPPHIVFNSFHESHSSPHNNNQYSFESQPKSLPLVSGYSPRLQHRSYLGGKQLPRPTQIPMPTVPIHSCHGVEQETLALSPPPPPAPRPHIFQPRLGQAPYPDLSPEIAEKYAMPTQHVPGSPMVKRSQRRPRPQPAQANFYDQIRDAPPGYIVRAQSDDRLDEQHQTQLAQQSQQAPHVNRRSGRKARPRSFCNSIVGAQA
ncbi:sodium/potassium-transporting ATPase subunit beta-1-interacting protein isoform X1 [Drosophila albomicans]|uniref:Sodium/potassium-transporting ATPase subunit beta-1-interacting protein n=1 Tax=Drosophila albomicans TaxID=7291 RepID=A0A9C6T4D2_DROAB|nr:sodium/potassium-transporting ATPase subunit beta-1-interacting protein isoform X1 [Drosophila albomicans]